MPFHYLHSHQTFLSVTAMDFAVAEHLARNALTASERAVLLRIAQSALKYPGVAHLKAATIAQSIAVSTKTVYRAVKRLHALGIVCIIPGTKLNGIKGANMYQIVPSAMSERVCADEPPARADGQLPRKNQSISFNLLKTSKITEMYRDTGYLNDYQLKLYELMHDLPLKDELKDALYAAILSTPIASMHDFTLARDTLMRIIMDIHAGTLTVQSTLRAVFKGAYDHVVQKQLEQPPAQTSARPVPFYDWLAIRA